MEMPSKRKLTLIVLAGFLLALLEPIIFATYGK